MNKPQVKIETFKKINGEIQIDYNGAYVGSLRPSPPWFKEDGIDTESIANLIESAPEMLELLKKCYTGEIEEPYNNDELNAFISKAEAK